MRECFSYVAERAVSRARSGSGYLTQIEDPQSRTAPVRQPNRPVTRENTAAARPVQRGGMRRNTRFARENSDICRPARGSSRDCQTIDTPNKWCYTALSKAAQMLHSSQVTLLIHAHLPHTDALNNCGLSVSPMPPVKRYITGLYDSTFAKANRSRRYEY